MRASKELLDYLQRREAFRARPYLDQAGKPTIGYGHLIRPHEKKLLQRLTREQAEDLLAADVGTYAVYVDGVSRNFKAPLTQHEFDGVVSLAFNIGLAALEQSTLLKLLRAGGKQMAAAEFDRWVYITVSTDDGTKTKKVSRGLANRRRMDRAIFERGDYAA